MEQLINFIIRPPRAEYDPSNDLLDQEFMLKGKWFQRKDIEIVNTRGDTLQCSRYLPIASPEGKPLPCLIYCHGNSGCRVDASEAAIIILRSNITVFTLDFSGFGLSGGDHVSLGWYEKDDFKSVVDYLRSNGNVSLIGRWGRSMGAVTMYPQSGRSNDLDQSSHLLTVATRDLFSELDKYVKPVAPMQFWMVPKQWQNMR